MKLNSVQSPCKGCQVRHFKCHSSCAKYQEYSNERQSIVDRRHKKCDINDALRDLYNRRKK